MKDICIQCEYHVWQTSAYAVDTYMKDICIYERHPHTMWICRCKDICIHYGYIYERHLHTRWIRIWKTSAYEVNMYMKDICIHYGYIYERHLHTMWIRIWKISAYNVDTSVKEIYIQCGYIYESQGPTLVCWEHVELEKSCHMCDVTHSHVWRDSLICVTWLTHMCDITYSYVWRDSFTWQHLTSVKTWYRVAYLKLQVSFRKRATNHRALLRKVTYEDKASYVLTLVEILHRAAKTRRIFQVAGLFSQKSH